MECSPASLFLLLFLVLPYSIKARPLPSTQLRDSRCNWLTHDWKSARNPEDDPGRDDSVIVYLSGKFYSDYYLKNETGWERGAIFSLKASEVLDSKGSAYLSGDVNIYYNDIEANIITYDQYGNDISDKNDMRTVHRQPFAAGYVTGRANAADGVACFIACLRRMTESEGKWVEGEMDCRIAILVRIPPRLSTPVATATVTTSFSAHGHIESLRNKTDPLYFDRATFMSSDGRGDGWGDGYWILPTPFHKSELKDQVTATCSASVAQADKTGFRNDEEQVLALKGINNGGDPRAVSDGGRTSNAVSVYPLLCPTPRLGYWAPSHDGQWSAQFSFFHCAGVDIIEADASGGTRVSTPIHGAVEAQLFINLYRTDTDGGEGMLGRSTFPYSSTVEILAEGLLTWNQGCFVGCRLIGQWDDSGEFPRQLTDCDIFVEMDFLPLSLKHHSMRMRVSSLRSTSDPHYFPPIDTYAPPHLWMGNARLRNPLVPYYSYSDYKDLIPLGDLSCGETSPLNSGEAAQEEVPLRQLEYANVFWKVKEGARLPLANSSKIFGFGSVNIIAGPGGQLAKLNFMAGPQTVALSWATDPQEIANYEASRYSISPIDDQLHRLKPALPSLSQQNANSSMKAAVSIRLDEVAYFSAEGSYDKKTGTFCGVGCLIGMDGWPMGISDAPFPGNNCDWWYEVYLQYDGGAQIGHIYRLLPSDGRNWPFPDVIFTKNLRGSEEPWEMQTDWSAAFLETDYLRDKPFFAIHILVGTLVVLGMQTQLTHLKTNPELALKVSVVMLTLMVAASAVRMVLDIANMMISNEVYSWPLNAHTLQRYPVTEPAKRLVSVAIIITTVRLRNFVVSTRSKAALSDPTLPNEHIPLLYSTFALLLGAALYTQPLRNLLEDWYLLPQIFANMFWKTTPGPTLCRWFLITKFTEQLVGIYLPIFYVTVTGPMIYNPWAFGIVCGIRTIAIVAQVRLVMRQQTQGGSAGNPVVRPPFSEQTQGDSEGGLPDIDVESQDDLHLEETEAGDTKNKKGENNDPPSV